MDTARLDLDALRRQGRLRQYFRSLAIDSAGNAIATGHLNGSIDFGGGPLDSAGGQDVMLVKFDPAGNFLWNYKFGDGAEQTPSTVVVDSQDNIVLSGYYEGSVNFGGPPLPAGTDTGFVAKYQTNGSHIWSKSYPAAAAAPYHGLGVATHGDQIVLFGTFDANVNFGGGSLVSAGLRDVYVAKLDANATHIWSKSYGDALEDFNVTGTVDSTGHIFLGGSFNGQITFGNTVLTSAGPSIDVFLAKLAP